ncbi:hypothetical protein V8C86DRAFT_2761900 [Haematococcus lacustris]
MFVALSLLSSTATYINRNALLTDASLQQQQLLTLPQLQTNTTNSTAPGGGTGRTFNFGISAGSEAGPLKAGPGVGALGSSTTGLLGGCMGGGTACKASMVAGLAVAPAALILMIYALVMYRTRTGRILRRETVRYDDQRGPVLLVLLLVGVLALSYGMAIISMQAH